MSMPPYQPPADATLVDIAPFGSPELGALLAALSTHLDSPTYQIELGRPVRVRGTAWAPEDAERSPATRRALYDAVESAVAAVEALGWAHAKAPEITLAEEPQYAFESTPTRIGARVLLTLRPGDVPPSLRGMPK